jgi:hypothetical protein
MDTHETLDALRDYLTKIPVGPSVDVPALVSRLAPCWEQFEGWDTEGMEAYKLSRMEDVMWNPPRLEFTLERHGPTAMGSSRATLHG